jgi:hypothetical protein
MVASRSDPPPVKRTRERDRERMHSEIKKQEIPKEQKLD